MIKLNKYIDYGFYKTLLDLIENESLIYHFQNVIKVKHFFGEENRIFKIKNYNDKMSPKHVDLQTKGRRSNKYCATLYVAWGWGVCPCKHFFSRQIFPVILSCCTYYPSLPQTLNFVEIFVSLFFF